MCTAISFSAKNHYFGRNLDLYYNYNEQIVITPRNFCLNFRMEESQKNHYSIIGMATVEDGFPLYYDAMNEKGLAVAALNFPNNARYYRVEKGKINIAPFELIPWILGSFGWVDEVEQAVKALNLVDVSFSADLPNSPLHWMISDKTDSLVLEPMEGGIKVHRNPLGVLTNNPPFEQQMLLLQNYSKLSPKNPEKTFSPRIKAKPYSLGLGGWGLPGDMSSPSRFVRAAFIKENSVCGSQETDEIGQFFHILTSVEQQNGVTEVEKGKFEYTLYSSCLSTFTGVYYYTTYQNRSITAVDMKRENLNSSNLIFYDLVKDEKITFQN
ncbi:MAG: choloylglycine hydrolase family protein [Ruminococcaceae bacterium]|nr:choloylglycine hydrolase family protein [Oscillospiraceae bacterium]